MPIVWDYAAVAFIDVLGFSNFVEEDSNSLVPKHLEQLLASLREGKAAAPERNIDVRAFSDSIILSTALSNTGVIELFEAVVTLQRLFVGRHVLIRGAIALGKHYADADLVYSQALVLAYKEERDHARFPRVLVDANLLDWLLNDAGTTSQLKDRTANLLLRDRDHRVFLNYLNRQLLEAHRNLLESYELDKITASVLEKLQWLAEYHNHISDGVDPAMRLGGPLLEGFHPL